MRELVATLADAARYGDWRAHLAAWWAVMRGDVTPEDRAGWPGKVTHDLLGVGTEAGGDTGSGQRARAGEHGRHTGRPALLEPGDVAD
jgi:hypothetical protein